MPGAALGALLPAGAVGQALDAGPCPDRPPWGSVWYNCCFSTCSSNLPSRCELWESLFFSDRWCWLAGFLLKFLVSFTHAFCHVGVI